MNKFPTREAIRFAYDFTFGQIGTIIGLIWIPMLIKIVGYYFVLTHFYISAEAAIRSDNAELARPQLFSLLLFFLVAMFLDAIMSVALVQQALGLRKGRAFAHFAVGGAELRVFGGFVAYTLFAFLFLVTFMSIGEAVWIRLVPGAAAASSASAGAVEGTLFLLAIIVLFYPLLRFAYFLVPAAIVEGGFGLARSWELAKGNVSRIVAVGLATLLPVFFLMFLAMTAIQDHYGMIAVEKTQKLQFLEQIGSMLATLPMALGLGFVMAPILLGLTLAPVALAYRALSKPAENI